MAATIATATGQDKSRSKTETRLGSEAATGKAATWHTEASVTVWKDGHGMFELRGDGGQIIAELAWGPESDARDAAMRDALVIARQS